ncbi:MAG: serine hydrolase domain-containing protein [Bacteroidota bacterium]
MPNQNLFLSFIVSSLLFASCEAVAQRPFSDPVDPESVGMSSDSLQRLDDYFHQLVDTEQLAGIQTAVIRKGQLVHFDSYGYSNIAEGSLLNDQSIFRIFSMTKPIVSVALMQLFENGHFKLEDPIHKYLPEFKDLTIYTDSALIPAQEPIQVIDLLRHTSGYSYGRSAYPELNQIYASANLYASENNREFAQKASQIPLQFEPGSDWQYGISTNLCGYLIEVLSGQSLDAYLQTHIFDPLGMEDTHFQIPEEKIDRFTVGYGWQEEDGLIISESQRDNRYVREVTLLNGGGGLVSTTYDYLHFCQMLLNGGVLHGHRILKAETLDLMLQDQLQETRTFQERLRLPPGELGFGLGFAVRGNEAQEFEQVFGWGGAVGTYFKIDPKNELSYVMMIQLSPYRHLGLRQRLQDFVEAAIID